MISIPGLALGAPAGKYAGKVIGDSGKVTFNVVGKQVRKFSIDGVYASCSGGTILMSVYVPAAQIKDGRFVRRYVPDPSVEFQVTLKGHFNGSRASGTVRGEGVCGYFEGWSARRG